MEIKTKVLTVVATLLTISSASIFAKANICHYSDFFHLGEDTPAGVHLLDLSTDDNIIARKISDTSFYLDDAPSCPRAGGSAIIQYGFDNNHACTLVIHDGAFERNPTVSAVECKGLSYSDLTYDGVLTYKYTLHFRR